MKFVINHQKSLQYNQVTFASESSQAMSLEDTAQFLHTMTGIEKDLATQKSGK